MAIEGYGLMTTHSDSFVMKIDEVFRFEDGRTIFVGVVETPSTRVDPRTCELLVDGRIIQVLKVEGERLTNVVACQLLMNS
jgi:hypothetical protein